MSDDRTRRILFRLGTPQNFVWVASRRITPQQAQESYERLRDQGTWCMIETADIVDKIGVPKTYNGWRD